VQKATLISPPVMRKARSGKRLAPRALRLNAHAGTCRRVQSPLDSCVASRYSIPMKVAFADRPPLPRCGPGAKKRPGRSPAKGPRWSRGPWSVVRGPWSVVRGPWSVVRGLWSLDCAAGLPKTKRRGPGSFPTSADGCASRRSKCACRRLRCASRRREMRLNAAQMRLNALKCA